MSPVLLDALTIFFIVAGLALLWANLRVWRRRTVPAAPPKRADYTGERKPPAPSELEPSAPERLTLMSDADLATSRARAEECLGQAQQATSETDRVIWLQMAEKWIRLVEDADQRRT
jgi:hypothetical protein